MKPLKPAWIFSLLLLLTVIVFMSCSKDKLGNFLIGKWHRIDVINVNSPTQEQWEFQADGTFIMSDALDGYGDTLTQQGGYSVATPSTFEISLPDTFELHYLNGVWEVVKDKDGYMMIVLDMSQFEGKGSGLVFREFQKL